ncbi:MAG: hypothetical protein V4736_03060 [Bdellovibrionota bacterium]
MPIPEDHLSRSVQSQNDDLDSVLNFARKLIKWRKESHWLEAVPLKMVHATNGSLVLERIIAQEHKFVAAINGSSNSLTVEIPEVGQVTLNAYEFGGWIIDKKVSQKIISS